MPAMNQLQDTNQKHHSISCIGIGCIAVVIVIAAFVGLIIKNFSWRQCRISLPDGSGSIILKARLLREPSNPPFVRKISFDTGQFRDREKWLPCHYTDIGEKLSPVNVYWYPKKQGIGPYIRFQDAYRECLIDIQHGITLLMIRMKDGSCFGGEIIDSYPHVYKDEEAITAEINGRPAKRLPDSITTNPGKYLGRIKENYFGFIPSKEASEIKIETIRQW
jgi:hypothetical protein